MTKIKVPDYRDWYYQVHATLSAYYDEILDQQLLTSRFEVREPNGSIVTGFPEMADAINHAIKLNCELYSRISKKEISMYDLLMAMNKIDWGNENE